MKHLLMISTSSALVVYVVTQAVTHLLPALSPILHALGY